MVSFYSPIKQRHWYCPRIRCSGALLDGGAKSRVMLDGPFDVGAKEPGVSGQVASCIMAVWSLDVAELNLKFFQTWKH